MHQIRGSFNCSWFARKGTARALATAIGIGGLLLTGAGRPAAAATHCVNPGGTGGCSSSIGAAVTAASAGDTIQVAHGTYKEDVAIAKSLSLIGDGEANTIIDATGKNNGITITGATDVVVSGFTVENADTAGIWITGSSFVTISDNRVINNDKALIPGANALCPPLIGTPFASGEAQDCGEGVFLSRCPRISSHSEWGVRYSSSARAFRGERG